jgi:hypothetical protein
MKRNIHLIPTDNPSPLHWDKYKEELLYAPLLGFDLFNKYNNYKHNTVNLYITSDEEIQLGDWVIWNNKVLKYSRRSFTGIDFSNCKKIILTTDPKLINDGIQSIDDKFLEWFVENPNCEYVRISEQFIDKKYNSKYVIILPTKKQTVEEYEQQLSEKYDYEFQEETIEQQIQRDAESIYPDDGYNIKMLVYLSQISRLYFIEGAMHQSKKMYSEEDLNNAFFHALKLTDDTRNGKSHCDIKEEFVGDYKEWLNRLKRNKGIL